MEGEKHASTCTCSYAAHDLGRCPLILFVDKSNGALLVALACKLTCSEYNGSWAAKLHTHTVTATACYMSKKTDAKVKPCLHRYQIKDPGEVARSTTSQELASSTMYHRLHAPGGTCATVCVWNSVQVRLPLPACPTHQSTGLPACCRR